MKGVPILLADLILICTSRVRKMAAENATNMLKEGEFVLKRRGRIAEIGSSGD